MLSCAVLAAISVYIFAFASAYASSMSMAYWLAMFAILIAAAFNSMYMISSMTVLQLNVPEHLRGRVMGFHGITYSMIPLGGLLAGFIASYSSPPIAIAIGTSLYLLFIIFIIVSQGKIRRISGVDFLK